MAEQPSRKRRIAKRALLAVMVVVLLVNSYVCAWLYRGWNCFRPFEIASTPYPLQHELRALPVEVWSPLIAYSFSDLPGGDSLLTATVWCDFGGNLPWEDCHSLAIRSKDSQP